MAKQKNIAEQLLPPLYGKWVKSFLDSQIPEEKTATCGSCIKCDTSREDDNQNLPQFLFRPDTKCCTFMPTIPNFNVGRILTDPTTLEHGLKSLRERINARIGITPLTVGLPPQYRFIYNQSTHAFGRSDLLLCPHYVKENGYCGIWKNREAVCSTFFCVHDRQDVGRRFWKSGILPLLELVQEDLAFWAINQLDIGDEALTALLSIKQKDGEWSELELEGRVSDHEYKKTWGKWYGKEEQFYIGCGKLVSALDWPEVKKICGPKLDSRIKQVRGLHKELLSYELPNSVTVGAFHITGTGKDFIKIMVNGELYEMDLAVFEILPFFDGRPLKKILKSIEENKETTVDLELIRELLDKGILSSAG